MWISGLRSSHSNEGLPSPPNKRDFFATAKCGTEPYSADCTEDSFLCSNEGEWSWMEVSRDLGKRLINWENLNWNFHLALLRGWTIPLSERKPADQIICQDQIYCTKQQMRNCLRSWSWSWYEHPRELPGLLKITKPSQLTVVSPQILFLTILYLFFCHFSFHSEKGKCWLLRLEDWIFC